MAFAHILSSNGATDYGNGKLFLPVCLASSQGVISTTPFPFCSLLPGKFLFIFQYQVKSHPLGNAFHSPQAELLASFTRLFFSIHGFSMTTNNAWVVAIYLQDAIFRTPRMSCFISRACQNSNADSQTCNN